MAFLLDHLPPGLHVVIVGLALDPGVRLRRPGCGRAASWSRSARPSWAIFSDEMVVYLKRNAMGWSRTAGSAVLEERTEVRSPRFSLAALSMQGRDDVAGFIACFAGDDRYVVDDEAYRLGQAL